MKLALTACFAVTIAAASASASAQDVTPLQSAEALNVALSTRPAVASGLAFNTLAGVPDGIRTSSATIQLAIDDIPAGVPLRVQLDRSYRMQVGTRIEGHLTEPVYLVDHVVLPADSKVFGRISGKHSVSRQARAAAMFNGDLTPLKTAEVTFTDVETPDGRDFQIETNAIERTARVACIAGENPKPHQSLKQRIAAAFNWTREQAAATIAMDHKSDKIRQMLYRQVPFHPQEIWAGTQFDAELTQPLEVTGQPVSAAAADLSELKLTGSIEARLLDPLDSATAQPGTPVEAVLTRPLFESETPEASSSDSKQPVTPLAHRRGKLLLPEGTRLIGAVVRAKSAGMFGRNGSLRLTFRKAELPTGDERVVHGRLTAAEGQLNANIRIDDEGGVNATNGTARFLTPLSLGSLQAVSNSAGNGLVQEVLAPNGLDMLTRVVGTAFSNGGLITGFGYYEVGKVVFDQWIARGHDVVFARNTRVEIELAQR